MTHPRTARIMSAVVFWGSWPVSYIRLKRAVRSRVLVIAGGDTILLVKSWHSPYKWSLPGGGVKPGEEDVASAARELYEETSVALGIEKFTELGSASFVDRGLRFRCHYYIVTTKKPFHTESHPPEVLEVSWIPIAKLNHGGFEIGEDVAYAVSAWRKMVE